MLLGEDDSCSAQMGHLVGVSQVAPDHGRAAVLDGNGDQEDGRDFAALGSTGEIQPFDMWPAAGNVSWERVVELRSSQSCAIASQFHPPSLFRIRSQLRCSLSSV